MTAQIYETNPDFLRTKNWVFGDSVYLIFDEDTVFESTLPIEGNTEASSVATNTDGKLLFFIQPESIYDSIGTKLHNLEGGNSSRQGALVIPNLKNDSVFYIIVNMESESKLPKRLLFYTYNYINNKISEKEIKHKNAVEGLSAVNQQNNRNIILASHEKDNDEFAFFIIRNEGVLCCPIRQNIGGDYSKGKYISGFNGSNFCFSPNGKLFSASPFDIQLDQNEHSNIFRFNHELPFLSNELTVRDAGSRGITFSSSSEFLFLNSNRIFQYDLTTYDSSKIVQSRTQITPAWNNSLSMSRLGSNGKIYYIYYDSSQLGAINKPEIKGIGCNYIEKGFRLNYKKPNYGLPNFNASYFYTPSIDFAYTEDCWNHAYLFEGRDTFDADGYKWIFQKSGHRDSALTKHCSFQFPDTGKWQVSHIAWNTSRADTVTKTLTLRPKWQQDVLGRDTFYCSGDTQFQLTLKAPPNMHCIHWNGEEPNLDEDLGPIVDYNHFHVDSLVVDTAGQYIVKLTNKTFCQMYDTITIMEQPSPNKPGISQNGNQIESSIAAHKYRWFLNGQEKLITQNSSLKPDSNGNWQLQLISEYGCESKISESFFVDFVNIHNSSMISHNFKIYPNPSQGVFTIKTDNVNFQIEVYDVNGKLVLKQLNSSTFTIGKSGNYTVRWYTRDGSGSQMVTVN